MKVRIVTIFWISKLLCISKLFATSFFHQIFNGELNKAKINCSLFIHNSAGVVIYANDLQDQLLVKIIKENVSTGIMSIKFNSRTFHGKIKFLYPDVLLNNITLILDLENDTYTALVNNVTLIKEDSSPKATDSFYSLPTPNSSTKKTKQTYIWMGNVGPYLGPNNKTFYPLKEQLVGCIQYFYFNNQSITFQSNGESFTYCQSTLCVENSCNEEIFKTVDASKNIFNYFSSVSDRSSSIIGKLSRYDGYKSSYTKQNSNYTWPIAAVLKWKQAIPNNYCLMEMKLRNGSVLVISTNQKNYITLHHFRNNSNNSNMPKFLNTLSNDTNILVVQFCGQNFLIKSSSGFQYQVSVFRPTMAPDFIYVGRSFRTNFCQQFNGNLEINFYPKVFIQMVDSVAENLKGSKSIIYLLVLCIAAILFLVLLIVVYKKLFQKMKTLSNRINQSPKIDDPIYDVYTSIRCSGEYARLECNM